MNDPNMRKANQANANAKNAAQECCGGAQCNTQIREHMDVISSCGKRVGVVDRVEADSIKLTKKDSADGQHHTIPLNWVEHVDNHVHLNKNADECAREFKARPVAAGV